MQRLSSKQSAALEKGRIVTFKRSEIIFDNRKSIMLSLRDVTELQAHIEAIEKIDKDKKVN